MPVISENQKMSQEASESGSSSGDEQEVEIKGTKFDLSKVAEDAQVDDDSEDDDGDDESGEDEADAPGTKLCSSSFNLQSFTLSKIYPLKHL